ncbi:MAG: iron-containing alcohol dehydrogenase family protein [Candidatus Acetothermia bacterium]
MSEVNHYMDFILPTKVKFGPGMKSEIAEEIPGKGKKRVGIVTTAELLDLGLNDDIVEDLVRKDCTVEIFSHVTSNPHLDTISAGYDYFQEFDPDYLVGLGGGSAIDTTKGISLCLANGERSLLKLDSREGELEPGVPYFAVPTTAGTGSEVDYWAVISDPGTNRKLSIGYPQMAPLTAVVDPELTLTLPPDLTLFTGIDALTHAIEAFLSSQSNKLSDVLALTAVELILRSLTDAVRDGKDIQARGDLSLASTLAGAAMQHVGLGLIHAMSHQVSGFYNTNHGLANALLAPNVIEFNVEAVPEKYDMANEALGGDLLEKIGDLFATHSVTENEVTIFEEDLEDLIDRAIDNVNAKTNPRQADKEEIRRLYLESYELKKHKGR